VKESIMSRVVALLTARTTTIPPNALPGAAVKGSSVLSAAQTNIEFPVTRAVSLVCAAYAASVLDNALVRLGYDEREAAFSRCDDLLTEFTAWPLGSGSSGGTSRRAVASGGNGPSSKELIGALVQAVKAEMLGGQEGDDLHFEIVVTVFEIFSRMDSLL
jgi:golgi phosphoprotein 3